MNNMKKNRALFVILFMIALIFTGCNIQTPEEYYQSGSTNDSGKAVTVTIRCDTLLSRLEKLDKNLQKVIPQDGVILPTTKVGIEEKDTVYDVLTKAAKANKLVVNFSGTGDTAYIVGINGIKEFSVNPLSGWKYRVNGEFPGVGCGAYALKDGDVVEILYTCDLGNDLD